MTNGIVYMGGCQNNGPLLGPLNTRCRIILRTQKGTIILTTTHIPSRATVSDTSNGCFYKLGTHFLGGLLTRALQVWVFIKAPDFWKLPNLPQKGFWYLLRP